MFDRPIDHSIFLLVKLIETLNTAVFKLVNWREANTETEPKINLDKVDDPDDTQVTLREIDLGDIQVECPECGEIDCTILLGLGVSQFDDQDNENDTFDIHTVGMVAYTCGCVVYSKCLTDKVAAILNASDNRCLTINMLNGLNTCEEHGVLHTEE